MPPSRSCSAVLAVLGLGLLAAVVALAVLLTRPRCAPARYRHAAVAADTRICSDIGRDILQGGGSAVDAAVAALICTSVLNPQSMGLGGGVIFTIYNASTGNVEVINARETAPQKVREGLLNQCRSGKVLPGAGWIAVPGELRGYEEAHKRYGKLPWKKLFDPTIELLGSGVKITEVLSKFLSKLEPVLKHYSLSQLFFKNQSKIMTAGETLHWPALAETLTAVADKGAEEFYTGGTAKKLVEDVQAEGGTLTLDDLKNYAVKVVKPLSISLGKYTIYSAPQPAAGPLLFFILNILQGFNFTKESISTPSKKAETFHRIAEALKFANGQRVKMEDPEFSKIKEDDIRELISASFADRARQRITNRGDHAAAYYNLTQPGTPPGFGTSHVSVLAEDGSAVSVTSTINHPFGSMVYSPKTGIILNNELADFCMKQLNTNISPGEMPPSSMTPSVLISRDGQSVLVIGGSGGTLIVPAVALVIINTLWLGYDLDSAIEAPVFYTSANNSIEVEDTFSPDIMKALQQRGHTVSHAKLTLNVVQGIAKDGRCLFPYSDKRKQGEASGY